MKSLFLKVYSEFSACAQRTFLNIEYPENLRHVPIRWLTLLPVVERLLPKCPALRAYFIEGEEDCSAIIWQAIKNENSLPLCYC